MSAPSHITGSVADGLAQQLGLSGAPAFAHRAFMLDVSRDRVPTMETLEWLIDVLGALRYNELQLYTEHTYAFEGHDVVWAEASPMRRAEIESLADRGRARGVELVANVNTFGHMERWLAHDAYLQRAECPDGPADEMGRFVSKPSCLAPTPENADFGAGLARELADVVGSDRVMIGGDEPFELGLGVSARLADELGRDVLYRTHLGRIMAPLLADGVEVLFWGDQFRTDPAAIEWIPDGATCVIWNYEAPQDDSRMYDRLPDGLRATLGLPRDGHLGFEAHARLALECGTPTWLSAGTSTWNTFLGRNGNAAGNIDDAAVVGARAGVDGFLLTDWGDNGHHQPLAVSLPSMVRGAVAGWTGEPVGPDVDVASAVDVLLGAPAGTGELLDHLGRISESVGCRAFNGSAVFDTLVPIPFGRGRAVDETGVGDARSLIAEARVHFASAAPDDGRWGIAAQELDAVCQLADVGLRRLVGEDLPAEDLRAAVDAQRIAWLRSSRPGGLEDSLARLTPGDGGAGGVAGA